MNQESRMYEHAITEFTDLFAWQVGHCLVLEIYKFCKKLPPSEIYGLVSQMQRSAVSITSNIAEGFGRRNKKEKTQFYYIAHGSLTELKNLLIVAHDTGYMANQEYTAMSTLLQKTQALLLGLIRKTKEAS